MTDDEAVALRCEYVEASRFASEARDLLEHYETLAAVSMFARWMLPLVRWASREANLEEEEARLAARETYCR